MGEGKAEEINKNKRITYKYRRNKGTGKNNLGLLG